MALYQNDFNQNRNFFANMRPFLLLILAISSGFALEEVNEENLGQLTKELFIEIEKRLKDDPDILDALTDDLISSLSQDCRENRKNNTIIDVKDSLENGAEFLGTPDIINLDDCLAKCCDSEECNTAVFKRRVCNSSNGG